MVLTQQPDLLLLDEKVGRGGFEPPTFAVSERRPNHAVLLGMMQSQHLDDRPTEKNGLIAQY